MKGGCSMTKLAWVLLLVGGLNWGLVGVGNFTDANWNLVNLIFGGAPTVENVVYLLVGLAALWAGWGMVAGCKDCK
jgi:hypothetical protein